MSAPIFDDRLRRLRRGRSTRLGGERFLHDRAFDDCLDRLADVRRDFASTLVVGLAGDGWAAALKTVLPGAEITLATEDQFRMLEAGSFDLCISIGELETASDLVTAAFALRHVLAPGGMLLGAIVGGNSLPRLRAAMLAADRIGGVIAPRIHPTIDGPSLSALLTSVGMVEPVIDIDRVDVSYASLDRLVTDLRSMSCTNILAERSRRPLNRRELAAARTAFLGDADRVIERFDLIHFAAWAPADGHGNDQINRA